MGDTQKFLKGKIEFPLPKIFDENIVFQENDYLVNIPVSFPASDRELSIKTFFSHVLSENVKPIDECFHAVSEIIPLADFQWL